MEAHFSRKPSSAIKVLIIVVGLLVGLLILAALVWCLWKVSLLLEGRAPPPPTHTPPAIILTHRVAAQAGFFQRASQKNKDAEEELKRDSWDYVPKRGVRGESAS